MCIHNALPHPPSSARICDPSLAFYCLHQAVVIGGGYIGMEVGSNLSKHGLEVTLVWPEKHLMERLFTPEVASFYEEYYKNKGIKLQPNALATSFEGKDGKVNFSLPCV